MDGVSIIICTRDRADDLAQTLESLARVQVPRGRLVELLVVDNGSKDNTAQVVELWKPPAGMGKMYVLEPQKGKGRAYNAGIRAAKGAILLFTDDDVRVPENWIAGMAAPIDNGLADAVAGGVRIADHLMRPWLTSHIRACLASTDAINGDQPERFVGANMCFHRRILETIPGFDESMGPGTRYWCHEETLLSFQIKEAGYCLAGALDVEVLHEFNPSRLFACNILKQACRMGISDAYLAWHWRQRGPDSYRRDLLEQIKKAVGQAPRLLWLATSRKERMIREDDFRFVRNLFFLIQYNKEVRSPQAYRMRGMAKIALP